MVCSHTSCLINLSHLRRSYDDELWNVRCGRHLVVMFVSVSVARTTALIQGTYIQ